MLLSEDFVSEVAPVSLLLPQPDRHITKETRKIASTKLILDKFSHPWQLMYSKSEIIPKNQAISRNLCSNSEKQNDYFPLYKLQKPTLPQILLLKYILIVYYKTLIVKSQQENNRYSRESNLVIKMKQR